MPELVVPVTPAAPAARDASAREAAARYRAVRAFTESLCQGLAAEDYVVQSMADVSPTKWHLAHTSWFFETFLLGPGLPAYRPIDPQYAFLFNSYYVHAGERHCRAQRGYISRPTVEEVYRYRRHVDAAVERLLETADEALWLRVAPVLELGLHHEQQHQELMLTDIKHVFSVNPLRPAYRAAEAGPAAEPGPVRWIEHAGGLVETGHDGRGFAYDNEGPRHRVFLEPFALADRLVTNGEYLEFMDDGGYRRPELWLSLGWAAREEQGWTEPFYWEERDGEWWSYTLSGMRRIDPHEPVVHLAWFEAEAFARWAGARLPGEEEWEAAARGAPVVGNLVESGRFHPEGVSEESVPPPRGEAAVPRAGGTGPVPVRSADRDTRRPEASGTAPPALGTGRGTESPAAPRQLYGDVWEWTRSPYSPYPGYRPAEGALGEYNGKFMCNQFVLRGGSCATSATHIRPTYRNFFPPDATWQFSGVRLARDAS